MLSSTTSNWLRFNLRLFKNNKGGPMRAAPALLLFVECLKVRSPFLLLVVDLHVVCLHAGCVRTL